MSVENINSELSKLNISKLVEIKEITSSEDGKIIRTRGFLQKSSITRKYTFMVLRDGLDTIQCICPSDIEKATLESFLEVEGRICETKSEVKGCTKKDVEIQVEKCKILSLSGSLPFSYKDAAATLEERESNPSLHQVSYHLCLDNRSLDFRTPLSRSIFRIVDGVMYGFRDYLRRNGFMEIKSPKLIESASEGGANVFKVDYFKKKAFLAQSPQLYKQMAIIGGFKRVYEIGHVYRAEESNINRYLSEFVGLDLEMEISTDYEDLIKFIYSALTGIFKMLKEEYEEELETIRKYFIYEDIKYGEEPVVLKHEECVDLLKDEGVEMEYEADFNNESEKRLGRIVKEKYGVDFFVIKDYPVSTRPFYTYRDGETTRSYDFILRGEEILSGAQRVNDHEKLTEYLEEMGIDGKLLGGYVEAFKYGVPPHGGCGIGLERLLKAFFGMSDIRYFSLFPRDPNRLYP